MKKYFRTDGLRDKVGENLINPDFILKLGWYIGNILGSRSLILIGKDTRLSCSMIESALIMGLSYSKIKIKLIPSKLANSTQAI